MTDERERAIAARHERGLLSARERIEVLCDERSFATIAAQTNDAVIAGHATVGGRPIWLYAQDAAVAGGAVSEAGARTICTLLDQARRHGGPVVGLIDTEGTRLADGLGGLTALGAIQRRLVRTHGAVPLVTLIMGPCVGAATSLAALADLRFMVAGQSSLLLSGPEIADAVAGEIVTEQELGGADVHGSTTGLADGVFANDVEALLQLRRCLGFLPTGHRSGAPLLATSDPPDRAEPSLDTLVPPDPAQAYDITELIEKIADEGAFFVLQPEFGQNVLCGFARLDGWAVGIVANQPSVLGGCLDADGLTKATRFVQLCNAWRLPVVTFVDTPGFLPGTAQEHGGIVRHSAELLSAYAACTAPKLTVMVGKAFGGAYGVMAPRALGADRVLAWPSADIALLGGGPPAGPFAAGALGLIDDVIAPAQTRPRLCQALAHVRLLHPPR